MDNRLIPTLTQVCSAFFEIKEKNKLLNQILEAAIQTTEGDRGSVFLAPTTGAEGSGMLTTLIATGLEADREISIEADKGVAGHVYQTREPVIIDDAQADPHFFSGVDAQTHYKTSTLLCVPMITPEGTNIGVIEILNSKNGRFDANDLQVLQLLALFAAIALDRKEKVSRLERTNKHLKAREEDWLENTENYFLSSSHPDLREIWSKLPAFAGSDSAVLVEGESGTGKEVVARLIHLKSQRNEGPFVAINCAAIPESLFEAELFGVVKGAATGVAERIGKLHAADGGTLFLDEVGELPLQLQAKLLRVLQDKMVSRVGDDKRSTKVDFRLIVATNRNLDEEVRKQTFREDLFYRVNVVRFKLPPLRERLQDMGELCRSILRRFEQERGWAKKELALDAIQRLQDYEWPGNIRQLQNRLESAHILSGEAKKLRAKDFQLDLDDTAVPRRAAEFISQKVKGSEDFNLRAAKDEVERQLIIKALERTENNKTQAAKLLGLTREGLRKAMDKLKIDPTVGSTKKNNVSSLADARAKRAQQGGSGTGDDRRAA
jgi:transcriptional regulator with GAF, ATPase, and Fis domain